MLALIDVFPVFMIQLSKFNRIQSNILIIFVLMTHQFLKDISISTRHRFTSNEGRDWDEI